MGVCCKSVNRNAIRRKSGVLGLKFSSKIFSRIRTPQSGNLDAGRSSDSAESCADVVHVVHASLAEFCMRVAPKSNKICNGVARFPRENLHDFERCYPAISMPDEAVIRLRAAPMSCMLRNARGARRPSFACALHRNRTKFAAGFAFSREFSRSSDSSESCADVVNVASASLAEFNLRVAPKSSKICSGVARFPREN